MYGRNLYKILVKFKSARFGGNKRNIDDMKTTQKQGFMGQERGFTLIEICIAMMIIGVMIAPALMTYNIEMKQRQASDLNGSFFRIQDSVSKYVSRFGRYPRPASLLLGQDSNDPNFGLEGNITPALCPDMTVDGLCRTGPSGDPDTVLIGAIPFNELQLDFETTLDPWGNKVIYAISEIQTNSGTYASSGNGAIQTQALNSYTGAVIDLIAETYIPDPSRNVESFTDVDMLIFSTGPSGKGGYSAEGALIDICIEPGWPENEDENCNWDNTFLLDENPRVDSRPAGTDTHNPRDNGTRTLAEGPQFYDDYTEAITAITRGDWNENEVLSDYVESIASRTGIGATAPVAALHVVGDVGVANDLATTAVIEGNVMSDDLCSVSTAGTFTPVDCFNPSLISSTSVAPSMNCISREGRPEVGLGAVVAIGRERVGCATTSSTIGTSNDSMFMTSTPGFDLSVAINNGTCASGVQNLVVNSGRVEMVCQP